MILRSVLLMLSVAVITQAVTPALMLSPYITNNTLKEAREKSLVDPKLFLNVTSHAGFLTVNASQDSHLYFWYFPVANYTEKTPWIVWLQGGPGASSIAGLFDEVGPFEYDKELKLRQYSWTTNYSMVFIDNPVGAGYSFTGTKEGFVQDMNTCADHLFSALEQLVKIFPELGKAPLYIAGESYAGRYIPALGLKMLENPKPFNLKGLIMGNPVLDRIDVADLTAIYYHWGLLDTQGALAMKPLQDEYTNAIQSNNSTAAYELRNQLLNRLYYITQQLNTYNVLKEDTDLLGFEKYIKTPEVREAMHVGDIQFTFSNATVHTKLMQDFIGQVRPKMEKLLDHYNTMIYCGQLDLTAPCVPNAEARRKDWQWSRKADFLKAPRTPWTYNSTIAGYVKQGGGLSEVLILGASHFAARNTPGPTLELITSFIENKTMSIPNNYTIQDDFTPKLENTATIPNNNKLEVILTNSTAIVNETTLILNNNETQVNATSLPAPKNKTSHVILKPDDEKNKDNSTVSSNQISETGPAVTPAPSSGAFTVSIIFNVILCIAFIIALVGYFIMRRRTGRYSENNVFYSPLLSV